VQVLRCFFFPQLGLLSKFDIITSFHGSFCYVHATTNQTSSRNMLVINLRYLPQVSIVKSCFFDFILIQFFWVLATILGKQALPMLLKLASVMVNKKHEWHAMRQLPVEIELNKAFQFHSVFACPVSRDQSTAENPPMLLPCGHVLCKHSIHKLVKGNNRTFKCPYCPSETTVAFCRQIHF
jgi:hypothetical protein